MAGPVANAANAVADAAGAVAAAANAAANTKEPGYLSTFTHTVCKPDWLHPKKPEGNRGEKFLTVMADVAKVVADVFIFLARIPEILVGIPLTAIYYGIRTAHYFVKHDPSKEGVKQDAVRTMKAAFLHVLYDDEEAKAAAAKRVHDAAQAQCDKLDATYVGAKTKAEEYRGYFSEKQKADAAKATSAAASVPTEAPEVPAT